MERHQTKLIESRNASAAVILPIVGMLGGLFIGGLRAHGRIGELDRVACVIKWGVTGFFAGLVLVVLLAVQVRRGDAISIRRLMVLIAVAGMLTWFFSRVLFGVIGFEGY